jgi:branched-chain amino acid transport system substrate-binding protein
MRVKTLTLSAAALLAAGSANAQYSDGVIKIGVMNDQSGLYADVSGPGGTWSAKKAVEDFGACRQGRSAFTEHLVQ